jgi:DNA-binding Lrp family transcriptional regulator
MLTAFMLITCERSALAEVGPRLAEIDGVTEVYTTTGSIDYIAIVRVKDMEALGRAGHHPAPGRTRHRPNRHPRGHARLQHQRHHRRLPDRRRLNF